VKLKAETVNELRRLKDETGQGSLNDLIMKIIKLTDSYRAGLKEAGWESLSGR